LQATSKAGEWFTGWGAGGVCAWGVFLRWAHQSSPKPGFAIGAGSLGPRQVKTRQDKASQDKARQDKTRQVKTRQDKARQARQDRERAPCLFRNRYSINLQVHGRYSTEYFVLGTGTGTGYWALGTATVRLGDAFVFLVLSLGT
jgi:hypothetical protein